MSHIEMISVTNVNNDIDFYKEIKNRKMNTQNLPNIDGKVMKAFNEHVPELQKAIRSESLPIKRTFEKLEMKRPSPFIFLGIIPLAFCVAVCALAILFAGGPAVIALIACMAVVTGFFLLNMEINLWFEKKDRLNEDIKDLDLIMKNYEKIKMSLETQILKLEGEDKLEKINALEQLEKTKLFLKQYNETSLLQKEI